MSQVINDLGELTFPTKVKYKALEEYVQNYYKMDIYPFETFRTQERQDVLFWYWRNVDELVAYWYQYKKAVLLAKPFKVDWTRMSKRTKTLYSQHTLRKAIDIVFDKEPDPKVEVPSWDGNYKKIVAICRYFWFYNLTPLETCHFQDDWRSVNTVLFANSKIRQTSKDQTFKDFLHIANWLLRKYSWFEISA